MNQVPFSSQDSVLRIRDIPGHLAHPQSVRHLRDTCDLHLPRRQVDEEQNNKSLQPSPGPHFHGEEVASLLTFPERGLAVAVMSNVSFAGTPSVAERIAEAFAKQGKSPAGK